MMEPAVVDSPSEAMQVNTVKVLEDSDFRYIRNVCDEHASWELVYSKKNTNVWIKPPTSSCTTIVTSQNDRNCYVAMSDKVDGSKFHMIKVRSEFADITADVAYDVLHDTEFRKKWDKYMLATTPIGYLNQNNDVCYYSIGSFPPFRSRDFVMQRSWLDTGDEKFICGHSVWHDRFPPTTAHIRGTVHLTVYFVRRLEKGCQLTYVTHSDPKGMLPSWFINRLTKIVAPRLVKKLKKACALYPEWKHHHKPNYKPWLHPDIQGDYPQLNIEECRPKIVPDVNINEIIDESTAVEQNCVINKEKNGKNEDSDDGDQDEDGEN